MTQKQNAPESFLQYSQLFRDRPDDRGDAWGGDHPCDRLEDWGDDRPRLPQGSWIK